MDFYTRMQGSGPKRQMRRLSGFRRPDKTEIMKVATWYTVLANRRIQFIGRVCTILITVGIILILSSLGYIEDGLTGSVVMGLSVSIVIIVGSLIALIYRRNIKKAIPILYSGKFLVLDGMVLDTMGANRLDCTSVKFISRYDNSICKGLHVRFEEVKKGTPLLMVLFESKDTKEELHCVFTPFMLSDEGIVLSI